MKNRHQNHFYSRDTFCKKYLIYYEKCVRTIKMIQTQEKNKHHKKKATPKDFGGGEKMVEK